MIHKNHENQKRYKKIADEQRCSNVVSGACYDKRKKRFIHVWANTDIDLNDNFCPN